MFLSRWRAASLNATQRSKEEDNLSILLAYIVIEELFVIMDVVDESQQFGKVEKLCRLPNFL